MKRLATILVATATVLVPVASVVGHTGDELVVAVHGQEVVVTGHDELDPALHVERPSGVRERHCPECVLDKRQSTAAQAASSISRAQSTEGRVIVQRREGICLAASSLRSSRAPPFV